MNPEIQFDEANGEYNLGATIDGVFVTFVSVPATTVESMKSAAQTNEQTTPSGDQSSTTPAPPAPPV